MTAAPTDPLWLAYYGDDFTGSTDALEFLARAGLPTALFTAPPTTEQLARRPGLRAVGVAGLTRALAPTAMEAELRPALTALRALGARHAHYKVCSTFDSAPHVGSIGRAIEIGAEIFRGPFVPLLVGAPALGRYCLFGNLFARFGIGSDGGIFRLDRHPAMSRHPVTPADESDLRLHLARQTAKRIGLLDILQVDRPRAEAAAALERLVREGAEVVLLDVLRAEQLASLGALIDAHAKAERPLFSVGSSGIEMALGAWWAEQGAVQPKTSWPAPEAAEPLLVASGSRSPVTEKQIAWAVAQGFAEIALDPDAPASVAVAQTLTSLRAGRPAILHTNREPLDAARGASAVLGRQLGEIVREVLAHERVPRVVIAGGDTSGYAARALGIESLEMIAPLAPGAPLCRASAPGSPADGIEINFKGGQVGAENYFGAVAAGKI